MGIPTVLDRLIQQAMHQVLSELFDPEFSRHSFGFRPGRSAGQAVQQARVYVETGYRWVVDLDLEKFFDRVNHDILMSRVARKVKDKRVLKLIRAYLEAGVLDNGLVTVSTKGTPQGGPLSPLLSNILLDDFDKELENRGHKFCRYADDSNVYVRSEAAGKRVLQSLSDYLERHFRKILWRQWKRSYTRAKHLMQLGLMEKRAWDSAQNGRGAWWNAGASHMNQVLPKKRFDRMGLVSLVDLNQRLKCTA